MISFGWAAFWIALAAVIISGRWLRSRQEALKYDALVRLAEKTGSIDEGLLKILCPPQQPLPPHWFAPPPRPDGRRVLRVFGTILMSVGAGLAVLFVALQGFVPEQAVQQASIGALGTAIVLGFLGAGLYLAARFVSAPRDDREAP